MADAAIIFFISMFLNRMRGGGWFKGNKIAAFALWAGLVWYYSQSPIITLAFVAGLLIEMLPPWGLWFVLGRVDRSRDPRQLSLYSRVIEALGLHNDHLCLFIRHLFIIPLLAMTGTSLILAPIYAGFVVIAYEIGWRFKHKAQPILIAEYLSGGVFGALLAVILI